MYSISLPQNQIHDCSSQKCSKAINVFLTAPLHPMSRCPRILFPAVSTALRFPRPPQCPGSGHPPRAILPQAWLPACLPGTLGNQAARGGSGWPGGWDKDHMKFPTLPHPIRKRAEIHRKPEWERDRDRDGQTWEDVSGWMVIRREAALV